MSAELRLVCPDDRTERTVRSVCERVRDAGGRALLVGGCVRDALLGQPLRDLDIEVHGLSPQALADALGEGLLPVSVGRSFEVLKLRGTSIDVSVPRIGRDWDPEATLVTAAGRRDFTINSMAYDPETAEMIDPFDGVDDLKQRILRHTSHRFGEDPLRVLRGMQLVARFELSVAPETVRVCEQLCGATLPPERVFEEWRKLLVHAVRPSAGLAFLAETGWLGAFPELAALVGCVQDPKWHPEGDVWVHTLHCLDAFAEERVGDAREDCIVGFAVLCHDLGKPATTRIRDGRVISHRHDVEGEKVARDFLMRLTRESSFIEDVCALVRHHLAPMQLQGSGAGDAAVRRLARRVGRIDRLVRVARADVFGRPPLAKDFPGGEWLLAKAQSLGVERSTPIAIVKGRHLIERGLVPGPAFHRLLTRCLDAQIDGRFADLAGGLEYLDQIVRSKSRESR